MGKQQKARAAKRKAKGKADTKAPATNTGEKNRKPKDKKTETWQDDLGPSLAALGLRIKKVAADGNCFFRACSDQLQGDEGQHLELRQRVVNFIAEHPDDFAPYMEDDENFESYCKRMREEGTWAGQHEQVAAARLSGVELRIYQAGQPCWTIHPDFPEIPKDAPAWHLSYHDAQHYNSLRLADDFGGGRPAPIPVAGGKIVASAQLAAVQMAAEQQKLAEVSRGTGCEDQDVVAKALRDAQGVVQQAIELLIARSAEEEARAEPHIMENGIVVDDGQGVVAVGLQALRKGAEAHEEETEPGLVGDARHVVAITPGQQAVSENKGGEEPRVAAEVAQQPILRERKIGRNRPCPCGSNKKYRKCCGPQHSAAERRGMTGHKRASPELTIQEASLYI